MPNVRQFFSHYNLHFLPKAFSEKKSASNKMNLGPVQVDAAKNSGSSGSTFAQWGYGTTLEKEKRRSGESRLDEGLNNESNNGFQSSGSRDMSDTESVDKEKPGNLPVHMV